MPRKGLWTYENALLLILAMSFGFAFFDRNAVSYLSTYIVEDLKINNAQVGLLGAALSLSWAFSAVIVGRWSDVLGKRKPFLIGILLVFSVCSVLSGLATSFYMLLASRLIMGLAEGPLMPICLAILASESSPNRRGLNIGIVQSLFSSLLGATIAPVVLVKLSVMFSWRVAFFLSGIPGLLCALAIMFFVREPTPASAPETPVSSEAGPAMQFSIFSHRNMWLCAIIACLMVSGLMLNQMFLPLFFTKIRHFTEQQGSWIMSATGLCATLSGFIAAGISDRIGRKPVVVTACLLSLLTPLAALYFHGPIIVLAALMFVGWIGTSAFALFMAVIPGETLPVRYVATATGLVACLGEIAGGGLQLIGGWIADLTTRAAPIQIAIVCALGGTVLSLFLKETAPVKTGMLSVNPESAAILQPRPGEADQ
jgi:MFS transporter, ACS family, hexuronate transporter